ncbi:MAG TPA: hypothetical protein PLS90_02710 [Candidatus Sumerlaeota bacterium]|nr:hypothetical protein [Candidatus Sumerlaeota bacterium]HOR26743.1 hypothetical protein [Candidatus Sumerlaeota bacterium]HPK01346.1 hypothetical protein [Candidatus Sumerlaeota bacterium]
MGFHSQPYRLVDGYYQPVIEVELLGPAGGTMQLVLVDSPQ